MTGDRGSLSIEYVILTPVIFLVFGLIFVFGRVASVDDSLDTGTRDAARAASLTDTVQQAHDVAEHAILADLGTGTSTCSNTLDVHVDAPAGNDALAPGETITIVSTCAYDLHDVLDVPAFLTGDKLIHVRSQFSVVVDPNRSIG